MTYNSEVKQDLVVQFKLACNRVTLSPTFLYSALYMLSATNRIHTEDILIGHENSKIFPDRWIFLIQRIFLWYCVSLFHRIKAHFIKNDAQSYARTHVRWHYTLHVLSVML